MYCYKDIAKEKKLDIHNANSIPEKGFSSVVVEDDEDEAASFIIFKYILEKMVELWYLVVYTNLGLLKEWTGL